MLRELKSRVRDLNPQALAALRVALKDRYVVLTLQHQDGSELEVWDGDGYTAIVGGPVEFYRHLQPEELMTVLRAALAGRLVYVRAFRFGSKMRDWFEISDRHASIGAGFAGAFGLPGWLVSKMPGAPVHTLRVRVSFDEGPAFLGAPELRS